MWRKLVVQVVVPVLAGVALLAIAALLYLFDPAQTRYYPGCPFHQLTRLMCPGCGSLRATHHLLHRHWAEALRWNPAWVIALPLLSVYGLFWLGRKLRGQETPSLSPAWIGGIILAALV